MGTIKDWWSIKKERRGSSIDEINLIMIDAQSETIGIKASNRFTISYTMLWNVSRHKILPDLFSSVFKIE